MSFPRASGSTEIATVQPFTTCDIGVFGSPTGILAYLYCQKGLH